MIQKPLPEFCDIEYAPRMIHDCGEALDTFPELFPCCVAQEDSSSPSFVVKQQIGFFNKRPCVFQRLLGQRNQSSSRLSHSFTVTWGFFCSDDADGGGVIGI